MTGSEKRPNGRYVSRRQFLRALGAGIGVVAAGGATNLLSGCTPVTTRSEPGLALSTRESPDLEMALRAAPAQAQILSGAPTRVWRYEAEIVSGRDDALGPMPGPYLGPTFNLIKGETVRINFTNELDEPSIVHWHGLHVPESADGHPRFAIDPGETYTYQFEVRNRPGTYWYHPHPHGRTGPQVYWGLTGLLTVSDPDETAPALPDGEYDQFLVIQDRRFSDDNQLVYLDPGPRQRIMGFLGDQILVNGEVNFTLPVATRPYRFRLLNGSNSRIYKLGWRDGRPLTVIGTDGGLLERPVERPYVTLAPAERIELWVDFSQDEVGSELTMDSLEFSRSEAFPIFHVRVEREEPAQLTLPEALSDLDGYREADAVNRDRPRSFAIEMARMRWLLNGRTFEMDKTAQNEVVRLGDLEVWEFVNESPRMTMPHPIHIHNVQFQILERAILPEFEAQYETLSAGYVDEGWKDTVLLLAGERVKVLLKFEDYEGLYVYHCHNLEHEDLGMMRNYRVTA